MERQEGQRFTKKKLNKDVRETNMNEVKKLNSSVLDFDPYKLFQTHTTVTQAVTYKNEQQRQFKKKRKKKRRIKTKQTSV